MKHGIKPEAKKVKEEKKKDGIMSSFFKKKDKPIPDTADAEPKAKKPKRAPKPKKVKNRPVDDAPEPIKPDVRHTHHREVHEEEDSKETELKPIPKKFNVLLFMVVAVLVVLAGFIGWNLFSVNDILVDGCITYDPSEVVELSKLDYGTSMFTLDTQEIIDNIELSPLIKVISIEKVWPDRLLIEIDERIPKTAIIYNGMYVLIDDEANVLGRATKEDADKYPLTLGVKITDYVASEKLQTSTEDNLEVLIKLLKAYEDADCLELIKEIDVTSINHIKLYTINNITIDVGTIDSIGNKAVWTKKILPIRIAEGKAGTLYLTNNAATFLPNDSD